MLAAELTLQVVWRFGMDAAIIFSDILAIPDASAGLPHEPERRTRMAFAFEGSDQRCSGGVTSASLGNLVAYKITGL